MMQVAALKSGQAIYSRDMLKQLPFPMFALPSPVEAEPFRPQQNKFLGYRISLQRAFGINRCWGMDVASYLAASFTYFRKLAVVEGVSLVF